MAVSTAKQKKKAGDGCPFRPWFLLSSFPGWLLLSEFQLSEF